MREKDTLCEREEYPTYEKELLKDASCVLLCERKASSSELILCYLIDKVHSISHIGVQITTEMPL